MYKSSAVLIAFLSAVCLNIQAADQLIEEIVVTASKRPEVIQELGISVRALQGEELQQRGAVDFEDYAVSIPNLSFGATDDGVLANRTISIRGLQGLNTTSVYIDDVPLDESVDPLVLDVERVEILRGPQGTLYGARGLGGTVRIITRKPEFEGNAGRFQAGVSHTDEGDLNYLVGGAINVPISDTVAARFNAFFQSEAGIFDRIVGPSIAPGVVVADGTPGALAGGPRARVENVDDRSVVGLQAALRLEPVDALEINARAMYQKTELDGFPLSDQVFQDEEGNLNLEAGDFTQERLYNISEGAEDEWFQFSLTLDYTLDYGTFTSSTGYFTRETDDFEDSSEFISFTLLGVILPADGLPTQATPVQSPIFQNLEFDTFVQELRFVSGFAGPLQLTTGLFYQRTDDNEAFTPPNIAPEFNRVFSGFVGVPFPPGELDSDLIFTSDTPTEIEEFGVYGEVSYDLTERLTATFGIRYFDTEVTSEDYSDGFVFGGETVIPPTAQSEEGTNLKGLIEFAASEEVFLYASIAEGFRIGGTNGPLPAALGCPDQARELGLDFDSLGSYSSDDLVSYEAGAKTTWNGGRILFNAAWFRNDVDNIQQRILLPCGFDFIGNLGAAETSGIEAELTLNLASGLSVQAGVGYTDAEFTRTVEGVVTAGDPLQQVPELTYSLSIDYFSDRTLFSDYSWFGRVDFAYVDESVSTVVDTMSARIRPDYTLINARLGLTNDVHEFVLYVHNLTDEDAVFSDNRTLAAEANNRARIVRNRPRTFGINYRYRF